MPRSVFEGICCCNRLNHFNVPNLNVVGQINPYCLASTAFGPCGRPNPFSKFVTLIHVIFLDRLILISPDSFNYFFQFFMS